MLALSARNVLRHSRSFGSISSTETGPPFTRPQPEVVIPPPPSPDDALATLRGKRICVIGAASIFGRYTVLELIKLGAQVLACDNISYPGAMDTLTNLNKQSPLIEIKVLDLQNWNTTRDQMSKTENIHALINNCGILEVGPFLDVTPESIDKCFDINVKAIINISQVVATSMIQRNYPGVILNVSSAAAKYGIPNQSVFCSTKGALDWITRVMAWQLGPYGIRVNSINPGLLAENTTHVYMDEGKREKFRLKLPLKRLGSLEDAVQTMIYLLHNRSAINGNSIPIDGGFGVLGS